MLNYILLSKRGRPSPHCCRKTHFCRPETQRGTFREAMNICEANYDTGIGLLEGGIPRSNDHLFDAQPKLLTGLLVVGPLQFLLLEPQLSGHVVRVPNFFPEEPPLQLPLLAFLPLPGSRVLALLQQPTHARQTIHDLVAAHFTSSFTPLLILRCGFRCS